MCLPTKIITVSPEKCKEFEENFQIKKKSVDSRQKFVRILYHVYVDQNNQPLHKSAKPFYQPPHFQNVKNKYNGKNAIVIGCGPSGLFAALTLLQHGIKPIIFERGKKVDERKRDIAKINQNIALDPESNYCFGEGGAGTFSDGKLYTRSNKRGNVDEVLHLFHFFGAPDQILYESHPHMGSDRLPQIITNIRNCIIEHGGEIHFNERIDKFVPKYSPTSLPTPIILSMGHSAHDSLQELLYEGFEIQPKGIALGVRVEHSQTLINNLMWHGKASVANCIGPASYSVSTQVNGRGVYSFCMCPGGIIVPASNRVGQTVINGMSNAKRNSPFANAGIVVEIRPEDLQKQTTNPLFVLEFQNKIEQMAWKACHPDTNSPFHMHAPAQRIEDFLYHKLSPSLPPSSYLPGLVSSPLHEWLPKEISLKLQQAFLLFDKKYRGWINHETIAIGVESRTSSPVFICRDATTKQATRFHHVYPCGEGAGYAGGITSSAIDGINSALSLIKNNQW